MVGNERMPKQKRYDENNCIFGRVPIHCKESYDQMMKEKRKRRDERR